VPVLARLFEAAGFSTVTLTMMPFLSQRLGAPRTAGIEYPFGHPLGQPHDVGGQTAVLRDALRVLETAGEPGTSVDLPYLWSEPVEVAYKAWQPAEPSPIVAYMKEMAQRRASEAHGGA
jgi:hypothetical protein